MPTAAEIEAARTQAGGWTKAVLAEWGVPWPPPPGWREKLIVESTAVAALPTVKLECELVPMTCWFSNLRSELTSKEWERCKRFASEQAHGRCRICRGQGPRWPVECHEIWTYVEEGGRNIQRLDGLIALCPACHEAKHIGFAEINGRLDKAAAHLRKVNGWTDGQAYDHIVAAFAEWRRRSQLQWELNVNWLERTLGITPERLNAR